LVFEKQSIINYCSVQLIYSADIFVNYGEFELAIDQINIKSNRLKKLDKEGLVIKPKNFSNWENEVLKMDSFQIVELNNIIANLDKDNNN